jgi:hypothetical protein
MEYGGMVHALEEIHRMLKPAGVLIDIHPVAESSPVQIHQAGKIDLVGHLSVPQWCTDYEQADIALAESVRRGLFAVEREGRFDSISYYDSAAELREEQIGAIDKYARDAGSAAEQKPYVQAVAARAEQLMQAALGGAQLTMVERVHISRLRPEGIPPRSRIP